MREVFGEILGKKYLIIFELLPFLAHLSRRLRGELIRPSVRASVSASVRSHFQT